MKCCPSCGQALPIEIVAGFRPNTIKAKIYLLVRYAGNDGITSKNLFDAIYGQNSGPVTGLRNIHVLIWQMNKKLALRKKVIRNKRNARFGGAQNYARYYLKAIRCK